MLEFVIIHGTGGSPSGNWFPWLRAQLVDHGHTVSVPEFPRPEHQSLQSWRKCFNENCTLNESTVLVGHSIGVALCLHLLNESPVVIRGAALVAGFLGRLDNPDFDPVNASFFRAPLDFDRIRSNVQQLLLYAGDNDPYVPLEKGVELAEKLHTQLTIIRNGGHLNSEAGMTEFPRLLEDMKSFGAPNEVR